MHPSVQQLFDLNGKKALVTGCNKGIGRAMALALAGAGADIIGVSATMPQYEAALRVEIGQLGRQFSAYQADFSNRQQLYAFLERVSHEHPVIDILVNNAGTIRRSPAIEHADADWDTVMAINLDAPFILAREIGKQMLARGSGKIIFTCSLLSFQGGILVPGYAASKAGISSLLKALSNEWAGKGVQVNGIAPGYIATDNTAPLRGDPERNQAILDRIPAGRWGVPEDLAGATIFLASRASDYVSGTIVVVDGGWLAR
ncbi:MAG: SDR family oxidoreductase [Thermoflavifilum sp.]|nr:SDR family oxidoreductase [Thermoflavifilum sp.]